MLVGCVLQVWAWAMVEDCSVKGSGLWHGNITLVSAWRAWLPERGRCDVSPKNRTWNLNWSSEVKEDTRRGREDERRRAKRAEEAEGEGVEGEVATDGEGDGLFM